MNISNYERAISVYALRVARKTNFRLSQEDAAQELRIKLWRSVDRYNPAKGTENTFYFQVLHNHHKTLIYRTLRYCTREETFWQRHVPFLDQYRQDSIQTHDFIRDLIDALSSERMKTILTLYLEGYNQSEIAQKLKLPRRYVNEDYQAALHQLKTLVGRDNYERI